jgi:hypothetical protein
MQTPLLVTADRPHPKGSAGPQMPHAFHLPSSAAQRGLPACLQQPARSPCASRVSCPSLLQASALSPSAAIISFCSFLPCAAWPALHFRGETQGEEGEADEMNRPRHCSSSGDSSRSNGTGAAAAAAARGPSPATSACVLALVRADRGPGASAVPAHGGGRRAAGDRRTAQAAGTRDVAPIAKQSCWPTQLRPTDCAVLQCCVCVKAAAAPAHLNWPLPPSTASP